MPGLTTLKKTFSFRLILAGVTEIDEAMANALFEAGCADSCPGSCDGIADVHFDREAESLADAIVSAVNDVGRAGFAVARIERDAPKG